MGFVQIPVDQSQLRSQARLIFRNSQLVALLCAKCWKDAPCDNWWWSFISWWLHNVITSSWWSKSINFWALSLSSWATSIDRQSGSYLFALPVWRRHRLPHRHHPWCWNEKRKREYRSQKQVFRWCNWWRSGSFLIVISRAPSHKTMWNKFPAASPTLDAYFFFKAAESWCTISLKQMINNLQVS